MKNKCIINSYSNKAQAKAQTKPNQRILMIANTIEIIQIANPQLKGWLEVNLEVQGSVLWNLVSGSNDHPLGEIDLHGRVFTVFCPDDGVNTFRILEVKK